MSVKHIILISLLLSSSIFAEVIKGPVQTLNGIQVLEYEKVDDYFIVEEDIMVRPVSNINKLTVERGTRKWKDGVIPYTLDASLKSRAKVLKAIEYLGKETNLRFVFRNKEIDYLNIQDKTKTDRCSSFIGRVGGKQPIQISARCSFGSTVHELLHAVGFEHEHNRTDRDKYIKVIWDNIKKEKKRNFVRSLKATNIGRYNVNSIMHYGSYSSFGIVRGKPVMTKLDGSVIKANRKALSQGDIDSVNQLYK